MRLCALNTLSLMAMSAILLTSTSASPAQTQKAAAGSHRHSRSSQPPIRHKSAFVRVSPSRAHYIHKSGKPRRLSDHIPRRYADLSSPSAPSSLTASDVCSAFSSLTPYPPSTALSGGFSSLSSSSLTPYPPSTASSGGFSPVLPSREEGSLVPLMLTLLPANSPLEYPRMVEPFIIRTFVFPFERRIRTWDLLADHFYENAHSTLEDTAPSGRNRHLLTTDIDFLSQPHTPTFQREIGSRLPWTYAALLVQALNERLADKSFSRAQIYRIVNTLSYAHFSSSLLPESKKDAVFVRKRARIIVDALMPILRTIDAPATPLFNSPETAVHVLDIAIKMRRDGCAVGLPATFTNSLFIATMVIFDQALYPEIHKTLAKAIRNLFHLLTSDERSMAERLMGLHTPRPLSRFDFDLVDESFLQEKRHTR